MANTAIGINAKSGGSLPAPKWEIIGNSQKTIVNGNSFYGSTVYARVQLLNKELESKIPNLRVEFGLVRGSRYTNRPNPRRTGNRIRAWSNWDGTNATSGTGFGGGIQRDITGTSMPPRPNRLSFTSPNALVGELPYSAFYNEYFVDILQSSSPVYSVNTALFLTGSKRKNLKDPTSYLSGSSFYGKTPQGINRFTSSRQAVSEWHVRLVELDGAGKVIATSDWSEPLFISPIATGYNAERAEGVVTALNSNYLYTFIARVGRRRF